ncbi:vitamin B12-dependent ribonucleotide reductase [Planctomycetales bacterium]|nr:vitamin B12-dependent ribonucleotide reductase [Planctomycetales bacterium]
MDTIASLNVSQHGRMSVSNTADQSDLDTVPPEGLTIKAQFCPEDAHSPFDTVEWTTRTAAIKGDGGNVFFEQNDCEFPESWSQLAVNVVASKYFFGEPNTGEREKSIRQVIHRVSRTIADWGFEDGYFATKRDAETFYRDLTWLLLHQYGSFNSPVWFNVGLFPQYGIKGGKCTWHWNEKANQATQPDNSYEHPQASACFIQSVEDNMEAIMDLARSEAMLFKFGSGTGTDLSTIRSSCEKLAGGGKPSGPLSFMRVYDQIAAVVKSGGKTRRAAKMQSLKVTHPDIMEFIDCKMREEEKAKILMQQGLNRDDAYNSILYQNANLSVRLTDDFMEAVKADKSWATSWVTNPNQKGPEYPAREVFDKIAATAWACGDPGVQFDTTINRWNTVPHSGRINASNPCSEYMSLDDTACNLASINLMKFRQESGQFDADRFVQACRIFFIAQEIIVDRASYPIKKIAENSHKYRAIGLGYTNLGSLMMSLGLPYDSDEARGLCSVLTALLHGAAYRASAELADAVGPFEAFSKNREPMLKVVDMHWDAVNKIGNCPSYLKKKAQKLWDEVRNTGSRFGFRNAQTTVLAPTGTISFMMDCDTTGIEPDIALVKFKQLAGGGTLKIVNQTVPLALKTLGYSDEDIKGIVNHIEEKGTLHEAPNLIDEHLPVFDCAFPAPGSDRCIPWDAHVRMMAAAQPFISGAISKTVNMPNKATVRDIADAYRLAWELGVKALAVYRDGSKGAQPLNTSESKESSGAGADSVASKKEKRKVLAPRREHLPDTRQSVTHKFNVAGHEGYLTVGLYDDGRVGELFITMAKEGSTIGGLMDCFGTSISMGLQYGVPLAVYIEKFSWTRFEPAGFTKNSDIQQAKSLVDYIFRWLELTFVTNSPGKRWQQEEAEWDGQERRCGVAGKEKQTGTMSDTDTFAGSGADVANGTEPYSVKVSVINSTVAEPENLSKPVAMIHATNHTDAAGSTNRLAESVFAVTTASEQYGSFQSDAPLCDACGAITVRSGNCYLCHNCGKSMGCS